MYKANLFARDALAADLKDSFKMGSTFGENERYSTVCSLSCRIVSDCIREVNRGSRTPMLKSKKAGLQIGRKKRQGTPEFSAERPETLDKLSEVDMSDIY